MSTPKKYIDLADTITERLDVPCGNIRLGIHEALAYLDRYPDQVPGRTITESMLAEVLADENWTFTPTHYFRVFIRLGITVVPDPELTDAEKWEKFCKRLDIGLTPWQIEYIVAAMDKRGAKAPEANDE